MTREEFTAKWADVADGLRRRRALVDGAVLLDDVLADVAAMARADADELLDLRAAARESGYSADHLGRLVHAGTIPNAGRPHAPRIRRADLPRKAGLRRPPPPRTLRGATSRQSRGLSFTSTKGDER